MVQFTKAQILERANYIGSKTFFPCGDDEFGGVTYREWLLGKTIHLDKDEALYRIEEVLKEAAKQSLITDHLAKSSYKGEYPE